MMWSETTGDHVFVFWNGILIFKTWCRGSMECGKRAVFDLHGTWFYWGDETK